MKRFLFLAAVLGLCLGSVWAADVTVQEVQSRLKARGFYDGSPNGVYDSETSAAVTRYQIRNGLAITGKLDAATLKALKVASAAESPAPEALPQAGTWRRLRNGDMQFLRDLNAGRIPPPATPPPVRPTPVAARPVPARTEEPSSPASQPEEVASESNEHNASRERLRDYVGAFVLAGLDPRTGAELEFLRIG